MRIAGTVQDSIVDGPGLRFTVFTQGCPHACTGCHNPDTHNPDGGAERSVESLIAELCENPLTSGLTLSGGEPFMQSAPCAELAAAARMRGLDVWCYSGYTFEKLLKKASHDPDVLALLENTDVLVDGRFIPDQRSLELRFRGSRNQRIISVPESLKSGKASEIEL
ncbi:MAG: anaerobic ribonucleoside-triphosphate reductase activating protein [Oscillospiraceae bacterium]|jgi:anaerobic ribonucleoside-triphosphate reductase activating protein|nr:anaerobic ribonucleoside-triphosphate reductase activating protein [Oscillospiraceae bacterium]